MNIYGTQTNGSSSTDGTSFVTGTWSPNGGWDYVLNIVNSHATAAEVPTSVVDNHTGPATITQLQTVLAPNGQTRLTTYRVRAGGTPGAAATLTINFSGVQTGCLWVIDEIVNGDGTFGTDAVHAAGTVSQAAAATFTRCPATMPVGARHVAMVVQSTSPPIEANGWRSFASPSITTPSVYLRTAYIFTAGDQFGYMGYASETNRIMSLIGLQFHLDAMDRNFYAGLTVQLNGVSTT